jgi:hypothetical protein
MPIFVPKNGASKRVLRSGNVMGAMDISIEELTTAPGFQGQYWVYSAPSNGWYLIPGHLLEHAVEQVALGLHRYTYVRFMQCRKVVKDPVTGQSFAIREWLTKRRQEFLSGKDLKWCCPLCGQWCVDSGYHQRFGCKEDAASNDRRTSFNGKARKAGREVSKRKRRR